MSPHFEKGKSAVELRHAYSALKDKLFSERVCTFTLEKVPASFAGTTYGVCISKDHTGQISASLSCDSSDWLYRSS